MKKIKYAILVLILLLLVGCGANVDYRIDVNTEAKSIQIRTSLEVDESDYKYIKGGRDELVSIMQKEKPDNLEFDVDKDNENKFIFTFTFISYDDYLSQYKSITGETSSSTFDIGEYSKESPFQTYQNIKFEDDLSRLLNWLKEALLNSGSIDSEHKDSLIHNQNYQFLFDGQKYNSYSYQQEYEGKSIIPITQNNIKIIIKKENQINFYMSLIIAKDKVGEFTENLSSFLKERNVNLQYEEVVYNDISCMKYDIQMSNIDLSHEDSLMTFNSVFGEGFGYGNSKSVEKSSFIKDDYQQTLNLQLNFHSLFGIEKIHPVEIVVDVDGVSLAEGETIHQNTEMPLTVQELNDGYFNISLNTTYTSYRFITFVALFLIIAIIIGCLWRFGFKKTYHKIQHIVQIGYQKLAQVIGHYFYENELRIEGTLIVGEAFTIQIKNINKIHYGYQYEILSSLYKYAGAAIVGYILQTSNEFKLVGCILLIGAIVLFVIGLIRYRTKAIYLKLTSGKEYSFVFEDHIQAMTMYTELLDIIEKQNEQDDDLEVIFTSLENMGEEKNEEA